MFLSAADLQLLTGRTRPKAQMRQLRAQGIDFIVDGDGRPRVLQSVVERRGGGKPSASATQEPDFKALHVAAA
jgi:hypothetical protein